MVDELVLETIEQLFLQSLPKQYKRGELLYEIDQPLDQVMLLVNGYVRHYTISSKGDEYTLNILKPHSVFPFYLAINNRSNPYYFEAMTSVTVKLLSIDDLSSSLEKYPKVLLSLTKKLASGLNQLSFRTESLLFGTASQRLAAILYLLGKRFGRTNKRVLNINAVKNQPIIIDVFSITHQLLASMTALTRETVTLEMMELKKQGLIEYQRQRITILDIEALRDLSSLPFYY